MEEAAPAGCGCLLQLVRRGDRNHSRGSHRNSRVAVGTQGCICRTMILFVDEVAIWIMAAQGAVMNHQVPKYVTRTRAFLMLGIPEAELNRISRESGLGHV